MSEKEQTFEAFEAFLRAKVPALAEHEAEAERTRAFVEAMRLGLRVQRQARSLTQAQVGQAMGVDQSYVAKLEGGRAELSLYWLARYSAAVGLDLASLVQRAWELAFGPGSAPQDNAPGQGVDSDSGSGTALVDSASDFGFMKLTDPAHYIIGLVRAISDPKRVSVARHGAKLVVHQPAPPEDVQSSDAADAGSATSGTVLGIFTLPYDSDVTRISAAVVGGKLSVTIPRQAALAREGIPKQPAQAHQAIPLEPAMAATAGATTTKTAT